MKQRPTEEQIRQVIDLVREAGPSHQNDVARDRHYADMASCMRIGLTVRCEWKNPLRRVMGSIATISIDGFAVTVTLQYVDEAVADLGEILTLFERVHAVAKAIQEVLS